MNHLRIAACTLLTGAALVAQNALAEITDCTPIPSVPFTISTPGIYCAKTDLTTNIAAGAAITVNANVVTIDLNGHRLGGGTAGTGTLAIGIFSAGNHHITVRNGTIRGFWAGVSFGNNNSGQSSGHLIEDIRASANTQYGIVISGDNSLVRNNQVEDTGGRTGSVYDDACGIAVSGANNRVLNNDVTHSFATKATSPAAGISLDGADAVVKDNRISNMTSVLTSATGIWAYATARAHIVGNQINGASGTSSRGIWLPASSSATVRDNLIAGFATTGIEFQAGTTGVYWGNVVQGAATAYSGGTPAGANFP